MTTTEAPTTEAKPHKTNPSPTAPDPAPSGDFYGFLSLLSDDDRAFLDNVRNFMRE